MAKGSAWTENPPWLHMRKDDVPIHMYNNDQTGPNIQLGGLNHGFFRYLYQVSMFFRDKTLPINPDANGNTKDPASGIRRLDAMLCPVVSGYYCNCTLFIPGVGGANREMRPRLSSLPLQLALFFDGWFLLLFYLFELCLLVYKGVWLSLYECVWSKYSLYVCITLSYSSCAAIPWKECCCGVSSTSVSSHP